MNYERVTRYVLEMPWAIKPEALGVILDILEFRANGGTFTEEELAARIGDKDAPTQAQRDKAAIIPIYGTIMPRANVFSEFSGGTSLQKLQASLIEADRNPDISTIILDIASPGGSVELVPETVNLIRSLKTDTVAVANAQAASAAYWLGVAADEFAVTPSGEVGSIGVWTAHQNMAGAQEKAGVQTTLVSAGKYKVEGHPFGPLEDEAREAMQAKVDHYYDLFVTGVAQGRGASAEDVRNGFGQGRMVTAVDAVKMGMADRVATLDQIISERSDGSAPIAIAASARITAYFDNPNFGVPGADDRLRYDPDSAKWSCPPTIDGEHFFGHVAPMGLCLRGRADRCVTPPEGDLEGFMRGYAPAAGGLRTGVVTLTDRDDHGHSAVGIGAVEATKWYDSVGRGVADVRVGRDAYGIWFSGMIRPGTSKNDRYALAASDVSGHWEMGLRGMPMLCGLPAVSVGGYPKGYLTHQEVMQGVAAAASVSEPDDTYEERYPGAIADGAGAPCGCHDHAEVIPLETILSFHDGA